MSFDKDGCTVLGKCGNSIRARMKTNSASSDSPVSFCLREIQRLHKCIQAIADFDPQNTIELSFDGTFVKHTGAVKFKLRTIKEDVIAEYVDTQINTELVDDFGFLLTFKSYKDILTYCNINSSDAKKVYISKADGKIVAEINDKEEALADSIGFPIGEPLNGDWQDVIIIDLETFRLWNILKTDLVKIEMTDKKVVRVLSEKETADGKYKICADLISRVLKK